MPSRPVSCRVVGILSIAYGVLLGLFWAWTLWKGSGAQEGWSAGKALWVVLCIAAPVLLVAVGYVLYSVRIAGPDARALKAATVAVLAVKAVVVGYWAVGLIAAAGSFSGLLHQTGLLALTVEVVPSGFWATVLALTSVPTDAPSTTESAEPGATADRGGGNGY